MKTIRLIYIFAVIVVLISAESCTQQVLPPTIKGFLNGAEVTDIQVTRGDTVHFKFKINAASDLSKVEVFVKTKIGLDAESNLFLSRSAAIGDLTGNSLTIEESLVATTDLFISVGAIDSNGEITTMILTALLEVSEFRDMSLSDALDNGVSKSFCNSKYGLSLYEANAKADPSAIDFGFAYLEADPSAKACLISFNEYNKVGTYTFTNASNVTTFKKATNYSSTKSSDLETEYSNGTDIVSPNGYTAGIVAANLQNNDVIAFKTQSGKYGLIQVNSVNRMNEAVMNQQTITFNLSVQK